MLKHKILPTVVVLLALAPASFAIDVYRITNPNTLVAQRREDLVTIMQMNAHSVQSKVRAFYNQLRSQRSLLDLQPGDIVKVSEYYNDGTAQIDFSDKHGYIARADLTQIIKTN
jgi:hypothetical protein